MASTSSTSRSRAAPTRSPTRSSWPSWTPTPPASSCRPRPATTARAPATANHLSPWVTTVAASTQTREFASTLTVTAAERRHVHDRRAPRSPPASARRSRSSCPRPPRTARPLCDAPARAGHLHRQDRRLPARDQRPRREGLQRPAGRRRRDDPVQPDPRRHRDRQPLAADRPPGRRHRVRRVHGRATPARPARSPPASRRTARATSSPPSRRVARPALFLKPDVTAPGVQILAGMTPTPESPVEGPPGEYFQAIAGTSMSSPHVAGAGLLLADAHPTWTPGPDQVRADDHGHRRTCSRRTSRRRPIRSTSAPVASTSTTRRPCR